MELCISMSVEILNGYGRLCRAIAAKDLEAVANGYSHYRSIAAKSGGEDTEEFCWTTSILFVGLHTHHFRSFSIQV